MLRQYLKASPEGHAALFSVKDTEKLAYAAVETKNNQTTVKFTLKPNAKGITHTVKITTGDNGKASIALHQLHAAKITKPDSPLHSATPSPSQTR